MSNEAGEKLPVRISIKLDLLLESYADFMKTVDKDMMRLTKVKGAGAAQNATNLGAQIVAVLEKIVPVIDSFAAVRSRVFVSTHNLFTNFDTL